MLQAKLIILYIAMSETEPTDFSGIFQPKILTFL